MKAFSDLMLLLRPKPPAPVAVAVEKPLGPAYPLSSERLLLRPMVTEDVDALYAIHSRSDVAKHLLWQPWTKEDAHKYVHSYRHPSFADAEGGLFLVLLLRETEVLIGDVNLIWKEGQGEIGFSMHPDFQGRGYATEACHVLFTLAFKHLGLHRITARCDARNEKSYRVMERLGMRREAHLLESAYVKGEWWDQYIYAILAREWLETQSAL